MSESVPLPPDTDLQMDKTQALITQAHAVQELVSEVLAVGQRLAENHKNRSNQVTVEIEKGSTYNENQSHQSSPSKAEIDYGTPHAVLWQRYSEGVQAERPIQKTLTVARTALKAGQSPQEVQQILQHDPQFTKIQQQQGSNKAQEYTQVMTRSAAYREQQAGQPSQQQSHQKQKTRIQTQKAGLTQ